MFAVELTLPGLLPILLVSLYAPPAHPENEYRNKVEGLLEPLLAKYESVIMAGDFNAVSCPLLDVRGMRPPKQWDWFQGLLGKREAPASFTDCYRMARPMGSQFTRFPTVHQPSASRLDYFLASDPLLGQLELVDCFPQEFDDTANHYPSVCIFVAPSLPSPQCYRYQTP